jgi:hypothetical protein
MRALAGDQGRCPVNQTACLGMERPGFGGKVIVLLDAGVVAGSDAGVGLKYMDTFTQPVMTMQQPTCSTPCS